MPRACSGGMLFSPPASGEGGKERGMGNWEIIYFLEVPSRVYSQAVTTLRTAVVPGRGYAAWVKRWDGEVVRIPTHPLAERARELLRARKRR